MPNPPIATPLPHRTETYGDVRDDDYYWMRDKTDPKVISYLNAENDYTKSVLSHTEPVQDALFQEMRGRIQETDQSVPVEIDGFRYYNRTEAGKQYSIYCRRSSDSDTGGDTDGNEEILLDLNAEAEGYEYMRLGNYAVSPDHRFLAYALDTDGSENYTLRVKDLASGELLTDEVTETYYGLAWANDNRTLFYTRMDAAHRPDRVFRHTLGADPADDALVYHEADELYFLGIGKSRSRRYLTIHLQSKTTTETHIVDLDQPASAPRPIQPRTQGLEYSIEHHPGDPDDGPDGERFFILTNADALNFRLMVAPAATPGQAHWQEVIPHDPAIKRDSVDAFADHLALFERENGLRHIRILDLATGAHSRLPMPEPVYTVAHDENPVFDSPTLRFGYSSLVTPKQVVEVAMASHARTVRKEEAIAGYDPANYTSQRLWATAADGAQIPISIVFPVGTKLDGENPLLLYGYGSYGHSIDPSFQANRVSLLERGVIFAIAHIRGGGEMGRAWYEKGKLLHKKNTFTDFIACAEHLLDNGYTKSSRLAIMGRSAGGLLMGAALNMRPDLFTAAVAGVPFMDVINTMLDPTIPLTVVEYEEWGNPNDPVYYDYMKSYSPYDNVAAQAYPHILATAGLNDPRVQYWEPAKWVAKLRTLKTDNNRLLLKTNMGAGHGGASGRYDYLKEVAFEYAFLLDCLARSKE